MKILVVSDSHGHNEVLDELIRKNKDVDIFLHAGDLVAPAHSIYPFRVVKGNCDYYFDMKDELILPTPFGKILMRHTASATQKYIKDHDIKIFISGHTHVKEVKTKYGICYLNPGAILYPRDKQPSYAILDIDEKECFITFYDLINDKKIKKYHVYMSNSEVAEKEEEVDDIHEFITSLEEVKEMVHQEVNELLKEEKEEEEIPLEPLDKSIKEVESKEGE